MRIGRVICASLVLATAFGTLACNDRAAPDYEAASIAGTARALREFVALYPGSTEAALAREQLGRLGPALAGFEAVFPSEVGYVCHLEAGDAVAQIPDDVIAYVGKPGAAIKWSVLAETFVYNAPYALRPAIDATGPVGIAKNADGRSVRTGKRCINEVQYDGDTVNIADGLQFAPGGTLAGPRR